MTLWIKYLDQVIRGDANHPSALREGEVAQPVGGLAILGVLLGIIYGVCMGCFGLFQRGSGAVPQLIATTLKVPTLFFLTLAVTLPSLYVFNAMVGSRISLMSVIRVLVVSLAVMLAVLASLGPIVAFFSASTSSYPFMLLLNVAVFGTSGFLGLQYMKTTLLRLSDSQDLAESPVELEVPARPSSFEATSAPTVTLAPPGPLNRTLPQKSKKDVGIVFSIWMVVFGLVGGQMAWVLRPFLGRPHAPFALLRGREASFFEGILHAIRGLMG